MSLFSATPWLYPSETWEGQKKTHLIVLVSIFLLKILLVVISSFIEKT